MLDRGPRRTLAIVTEARINPATVMKSDSVNPLSASTTLLYVIFWFLSVDGEFAWARRGNCVGASVRESRP